MTFLIDLAITLIVIVTVIRSVLWIYDTWEKGADYEHLRDK